MGSNVVPEAPPPTPWDDPPVAFEVNVRAGSDFLIVEVSLVHHSERYGRVPDLGGFSGDAVYVNEPCWLFRLFGDTTEARIERAKKSVVRRAAHELSKRQRLASIADRCS